MTLFFRINQNTGPGAIWYAGFLWWAFIILTVFFTPAPDVPKGNGLPIFSQHQPGLKELDLFILITRIILKSFLLVPIHIFFAIPSFIFLLPASS
jgi:hypothetical protein